MSRPEDGPRLEEIPDPFSDRPNEPSAGGGCGKPALIGCGVLLLAVLAGLVLFVTRVESVLAWSLRQHRDVVLANLPEEITDAERARLERAFDAVLAALQSGELERAGLPELQRVVLRTSGRIDRLQRSDVVALSEALERVAGAEPPAARPEADEPAPSEPTASRPARARAARAA